MRTIALAAGVLLAACGRHVDTPASSSPSSPAPEADVAPLAGSWRGTDGNLDVRLVLAQHGDSLSGTGTYRAVDSSRIGCGGETIPASGTAGLAGVLTERQFAGRFRFDPGGWTPPYIATWIAPDSLRGGFMSVDRGRCTLILVRQR